jgi:hypothetical protein
MKQVIAIVCATTALIGCARSNTETNRQGAGLTSVSVNLPDKANLPESLKGADLIYCLTIIKHGPFGGMGLSEYSCASRFIPGGVATLAPTSDLEAPDNVIQKGGAYTSNLKIDAQLSSNEHYEITLTVGQKKCFASVPVMNLASPSSDACHTFTVDYDKPYYSGFTTISPSDMQGKSAVTAQVKLRRGAKNPLGDIEQITTPGRNVDLDVKTEFDESGNDPEAEELLNSPVPA